MDQHVTEPTTTPAGGLNRYVAGMAAAGAIGVIAAALLLPTGPLDGWALAVLLGVVVLGTWFPVSFRHDGDVQGFTTEEAGFLALLFVVPLGWVPVAMALAALMAHAAKVRNGTKVAFNVGQIALWSAAAAGVFHLIGPGPDVLAPRSLLAAAAAMVTLNAISFVAMAELFRRLEATTYRETAAEVLQLNLVTTAGNSALGLLLAFTAVTDARVTVVAAVAVVASSLGYRWYASAMHERRVAAGSTALVG